MHLLEPDGKPRHVVLTERACTTARTSLDGKSVVLLCKELSAGDWSDERKEELIEVSIDPPRITRRTPMDRWTERNLLAVSSRGYLMGREYPRDTFYARLIAPGTGRELAETHAWSSGGVVRFADGRVELFGDTSAAEARVYCVSDGVARPLSTCRDTAVVRGRFRLD